MALLLAFFALLALLVAQGHPQSQSKVLVFTHATLIDATGAPAKLDMSVAITGDRIAAIGAPGKVRVPTDAQVIDAAGKFLIPGLWEMHAHTLYEGWSISSAYSKAARAMKRAYRTRGPNSGAVTSPLTRGECWKLVRLRINPADCRSEEPKATRNLSKCLISEAERFFASLRMTPP